VLAAPPGTEQRQRDTTTGPEDAKQPMTPEDRDASRRDAAAVLLRSAWRDAPQAAEAVISCEAFDAFAHRLESIAARGHDPYKVLGRVPLAGWRGNLPIQNADRPAAFAESLVRALAERLPDSTEVDRGRQRLEDYARQAQAQATPVRMGTETGRPQPDRTTVDRADDIDAAADTAGRNADAHRIDRDGDRADTQLGWATAADPTTPPHKRTEAAARAEQHASSAVTADAARTADQSTADRLRAKAADLRHGAYDTGAPAARLAGEAYPRSIEDSLKQANRSQGRPKAKPRKHAATARRERNAAGRRRAGHSRGGVAPLISDLAGGPTA